MKSLLIAILLLISAICFSQASIKKLHGKRYLIRYTVIIPEGNCTFSQTQPSTGSPWTVECMRSVFRIFPDTNMIVVERANSGEIGNRKWNKRTYWEHKVIIDSIKKNGHTERISRVRHTKYYVNDFRYYNKVVFTKKIRLKKKQSTEIEGYIKYALSTGNNRDTIKEENFKLIAE